MTKEEYVKRYHKLPLILEDEEEGLVRLSKVAHITPLDEEAEVLAYGKLPKIMVPNPVIGMRGPQGTKGYGSDGTKFDSIWEYAYYVYRKELCGDWIERNRTENLKYWVDGKERDFYPDFKTLSGYVEVKGIWREKDQMKKDQHPEVEFVDGSLMKPIIEELNKKLPNWRKGFTEA